MFCNNHVVAFFVMFRVLFKGEFVLRMRPFFAHSLNGIVFLRARMTTTYHFSFKLYRDVVWREWQVCVGVLRV